MARRQFQAGNTRLGCMLWVIAVVVVGMILYKAVPVKIASAQFYSYMDEQAKFAQRMKPEALKADLLKRAHDLGLPVEPKNLTVERRGDRIVIQCTYTVPLEFPFYTYAWKFEHKIDERMFII